MKKFIGLVALLLLGSGLVTVAAPSPAQAACPYTNCIATRTLTSAPGKAVVNRRAPYRYAARVVATQGSARPTGAFFVRLRGAGVDIIRYYPNYRGGTAVINVRFRQRGVVRFTARYTASGAFRNSQGTRYTRVVRR